jgi:hypothetical protein
VPRFGEASPGGGNSCPGLVHKIGPAPAYLGAGPSSGSGSLFGGADWSGYFTVELVGFCPLSCNAVYRVVGAAHFIFPDFESGVHLILLLAV